MKALKARSKANPARRGAAPDTGKFANFSKTVESLAEIGRGFYARGWVLGTSGNFSAVVSRRPLRLAITSTGLDKGALMPGQFLEIDETANVVRGEGRPSAEALLHLRHQHARGNARLTWIPFAATWALYLGRKPDGSQAARGDFGVSDGGLGALRHRTE